MDTRQLDSLAREIGARLPRRGVLGLLGGLVLLSAGVPEDLEAARRKKRRHRQRKRRKKCQGNRKKCGNRCIRKHQCCRDADCGPQGACVQRACACPAGQKPCQGGCIAQDACCSHSDCPSNQDCVDGACVDPVETRRCGSERISRYFCCQGACPGSQTCVDDHCVCPDPAMSPCADGTCVTGGQCCEHSQCAGNHVCVDGFCSCPGADELTCGHGCCDDAEICDDEPSGPVCATGGCQASDWCNTNEYFICENSGEQFCTCITSFDTGNTPLPACVDYYSLAPDDCDALSCATNDDCGPGTVCIEGSTGGQGPCGCEARFCARVCGAGVERRGGRASVAAAATRMAALPRAKLRPSYR